MMVDTALVISTVVSYVWRDTPSSALPPPEEGAYVEFAPEDSVTCGQIWTGTPPLENPLPPPPPPPVPQATTTDGVPVVLTQVEIPSGQTVMWVADVIGRRTGGSAGSPGDSAYYSLKGSAKNVSGTVSIITQGAVFTSEDQDYWDATFVVAATGVALQVTGATNNTIDWTSTLSTRFI